MLAEIAATSEKLSAKDKIEEILEMYPVLRERVRIELINSNQEFSLSSLDFGKPKISKTNNINSEIEDYVVDKINSDYISKELMTVISSIEAGLKCLTERELKVVSYIYIDKDDISVEDFADIKLGQTKQNFYNIKRKAMKKLCLSGLANYYETYIQIYEDSV